MREILTQTVMSGTKGWKPRYFDIGVNFSDSMFQGCYNGSTNPKHPPDVEKVIARAQLFNVHKMLVTASTIKESKDHFDLVEKYKGSFGSTVGVHPCSVASEFYGSSENQEPAPSAPQKLQDLQQIAIEGFEKGIVKAFGEIGLDYDRLHYSTAAQQKEMFFRQLKAFSDTKIKLPYFLHMRNACDDFIDIIKPFLANNSIPAGVVHSFTGTKEELLKLLDLGFYIGINGCSLKTEENLEVAKLIPIDRLLIETDAPWCEIRKSHASYKFLKPYPSIFYPELENLEELEDVSNVNNAESKTNPGEKSKKQQTLNLQPKHQAIKLDELVPFPSIKKENFVKHEAAIEQKLAGKGSDSVNRDFGEFAYPLIKSRNEPIYVGNVAAIICNLHSFSTESEIQNTIDTIYNNSCKIFNL